MSNTEQPVTDSAPLSNSEIEAKLADTFFNDGEKETQENDQQTAEPTAEEQPTEQPTQAQDDSEDVDFEGLQLKLPKEAAQKLKSAVEGYKDYTKKTQEVAEHRRLVEAQSRQIQEQQAFQASISQELSQFQALDAQLAQYKKLDWTSLPMEDAFKYRAMYDQIKEQKEDLGRQIQTKKGEFDQKLNAYKQTQREQQAKAVKAAIPDWSDKTAEKVIAAASSVGFTNDELGNIYDPRFVILAHKAAQWDALQASKPGVNQRANSAPPVVKPGAANTQPNKQIEHMNFRKAIKNAPDNSTKNALILKRLESKV